MCGPKSCVGEKAVSCRASHQLTAPMTGVSISKIGKSLTHVSDNLARFQMFTWVWKAGSLHGSYLTTASTCLSFVVWRHFILNVSQQRDTHLCSIVSSQDVADVVCFNLHLDLFVTVSLRTTNSGQGVDRPSPEHLSVYHTRCLSTTAHLGHVRRLVARQSLPMDSLQKSTRIVCYRLSNS